MSQRSRLIVGCGYVGKPLAAAWHQLGDKVFATTRSQERARQFEQAGWHPVIADVTNPETLRQLPNADTVVFAVGYDATSGKSREDVYSQGLINLVERLPDSTKRLIFVSTTGVYGDANGQFVDEETPCEPVRAGGKAFLKAEQFLRDHPTWSRRSSILRMAGIYGPDRVPRLADLKAGRAIPAPGDGALNLIYVDDAVQAIRLAADASQVSPVYIVSDGHPVDRLDYYREVARLAGGPEPTFEASDGDSPAAQRARLNRKMQNLRLVEELGFQPQYPSYQQGLSKILT